MAVLFPRDITLKSKSEGYYDDDGKWVKGAETDVIIKGDAQPMTQKEIDNLDIGKRNLGKIKIFTDYALKIADDGTNQNGDLIQYDDGSLYEVIGQDPHRSNVLNNTKYIGEYRKS